MYTHIYIQIYANYNQIWYISTSINSVEIFSNTLPVTKKIKNKSLISKQIRHLEIQGIMNWPSRHKKTSEISNTSPYLHSVKERLTQEYCSIKPVLWFVFSLFKASKKKVLFISF